jgi:uncharacterized protein (DUF1330 family)
VHAVVPLLRKHGAEILVADYESQQLEGEPRKVNVVLKFPSAEAARNWYNDPAYGPVKQISLDSTGGRGHCDDEGIQSAGLEQESGTGRGCMVMHPSA